MSPRCRAASSITSTSSGSASRAPEATSFSIWVRADDAIGPRQIIGAASSTRKPIDITLIPQALGGISLRSGPNSGSSSIPVICGIEGP